MLRQTLPLLLAFIPVAAHAQAQPPVVIQSGASIQIPVPANADKPRIQVLVAGTNTILDDERANVKNGVATARLDADPGTYDIRLVTNDKNRSPIGAPRTVQVPGLKREAGRWLFNGSPVLYEGTNAAGVFSTVPNLKRDKKAKLPISVPTTTQVKWDLATFGANFTPKLDPSKTFDKEASRLTFQDQKDKLGASNPNGAVFLTQPFTPQLPTSYTGLYIEALAPLVDGVIIECDSADATARSYYQGANPLLKIARRNVEETPNFDLPLFARFTQTATDLQYLRAFQDGASNLIVPEGTSSPVLDVLTNQAARFSGVVTLEDAGLRVDDFDRFAPALRNAGRVPLLARLPGEGNGQGNDKSADSLFIVFDSSTNAALLDKIESAAKLGATIYCEGTLPPALLPRWAEITRTQITALPAPHQTTVTLADPWFWGTLVDQNFDASQTVSVTPKQSMTAQTRDVKGEARETIARPLARFNDDPNGIMLCPVDKGRIIWAPFNVAPISSTLGRQRTKIGLGLIYDNDLEPSRMTSTFLNSYYAAISGAMQAALVEYTATKGYAPNVSVALRAIPAEPDNPKSSAVSLIAFFNSSNEAVDLNAVARGNGNYAIDLMTNKTFPVKVRDFGVSMQLQIPANGFRWIALTKDEKAWNDTGKKSSKARLN